MNETVDNTAPSPLSLYEKNILWKSKEEAWQP